MNAVALSSPPLWSDPGSYVVRTLCDLRRTFRDDASFVGVALCTPTLETTLGTNNPR